MSIVLSLIFLSLGIGVLVLIHICIVGRAIRQELTENNVVATNAAGRGSSGSTSMSRDDIENLPCFNFVEKEIKGSDSPCPNCAVCLENFTVGEKCRLLPLCNHSFHAECVDLWLVRASICPICRANADVGRSDSLRDENRSDVGENPIEFRDGYSTGEGEVRAAQNEENANFNGSSEHIGGGLNLSVVVTEVRNIEKSPSSHSSVGEDVNESSCSTHFNKSVI